MRRASPLVLVTACLLAQLGGCASGAKTPEEAYQRFAKAVVDRNGSELFDALDQETRWSWMNVQKWQREAYDIVISNYPEGPARERDLRRFEKGATAGSARELFVSEVGQALLPTLAPLVIANPTFAVEPPGDVVEAVLPGGGRVRFARGKKGRWGFAGLAPNAEDRKARAYHDLELVRASGADYERAAARGAR